MKHPYFWKFFLIGVSSFFAGVVPLIFLPHTISTFLLSFGIALCVAFLCTRTAFNKLAAPVASMEKFVESLRQGRYDESLSGLSAGGYGRLSGSLRELAKDLDAKVASLSNERAQFRAMLASMIEGVIAVDQQDHILFCNDAARRMLEEPKLGHPKRLWEFTKLLPLREMVESTRSQERSIKGEISVRKFKEELILEVQATPLAGAAKPGVVVVFHDITDLRKLEVVRRDFVANVSHELKTPLTAIKGYVETLIGGAIFDEKNNIRFLRKIESKVELLAEQVQDLLHLARIESNKDSLPLQSVDLNRVMIDIIQDHELAIKNKGLKLESMLSGDHVAVWGDENSIRQVTHNLLDNAIKYTPAPGKIVLRVKKEKDFAQVEVEDSGIGIPHQDQERIFERFYRVDKARSSEVSGSGLGLSIVKHLVQSMRGEIAVESQPQKGSRFTVHLPLSI